MNWKTALAPLGILILTLPVMAQAQQAPPKVYTGSFGAGYALTGGNTDTSSFNLGFELTRDPKTKNLVKSNGLYLRSDQDNETTADRLRLDARDEYALSQRTFIFGDLLYLRDPFKDITYLLNPQGGIGYRLYMTDRAVFSLSGGGGAVWENNPGWDVNASGTLNAGENFSYKISDIARLTQVIAGLWKTEDFDDYLIHFGIALATSITKSAELKVEFLDDHKNVTPNPGVKKNDTAFITSFIYKF